MVAALIIAAGRTARKDDLEPLVEVGTMSAIQRIVMVFQRADIERVVIVCDADRYKTEKLAAHMNVVYLPGKQGAEMLDNVKIGLDYLSEKCTAAVITHVGVPLFSVGTVRALMNAEGSVCVPSHHGKAGHPLFLRSEHFQAVLTYSGDGGLAGAIKKSGLQRNFVEVTDEGVLANVQDVAEYEHLLADDNLGELHPDIRIRIVKQKPFYGPGPHLLLQLTQETGSVLEACRNMGISYSKGRNIISIMEEQLGYSVIESKQGGRAYGRSVVTEKGKELMQNYADFCAEAKQCSNELFMKYFGE